MEKDIFFHCVYFQCVLTKRGTKLKLSVLVGLIEKNRSSVLTASKSCIAELIFLYLRRSRPRLAARAPPAGRTYVSDGRAAGWLGGSRAW